MKKIGITGSLASGKTTASKILSSKAGPLFSADAVVSKIYRDSIFKNRIIKFLKIPKKSNLKNEVKKRVLSNKINLKILERIIHPMVRKEMFFFFKKHKNKKLVFLEIPLLIESKLIKYFDKIIFIKSKKNVRLKRYMSKYKKSAKLFHLLDKKQIKDSKKLKYCDHVVINNNSLSNLKKNLFNILKLYE